MEQMDHPWLRHGRDQDSIRINVQQEVRGLRNCPRAFAWAIPANKLISTESLNFGYTNLLTLPININRGGRDRLSGKIVINNNQISSDILISVIMSVYNEKESELKLAIESILNQTFKMFEFIIILDNPTNKSVLRLLKHYSMYDKRINVLVNKKNLGLANSLNKGIKIAKGKYIARMDADDISVLNRLEKQFNFLEDNKNYDVVATDRLDINESGELIDTSYLVVNSFDDIKSILPFGSVITHPSVLMRKSFILSMNGYRNFKAAQDYDLWLRLITSGYKVKVLPDKLIYYRIRNSGISLSNPYKRYLYSKYARKLYLQRRKSGQDDYSEDNLSEFLLRKKFFNQDYTDRYNKAYNYLFLGVNKIKKREVIKGITMIIFALFMHREMFETLYLASKFSAKLKDISAHSIKKN
ncbi:glycosyltransferase [Paenibacillus sp.]|uniref:glycosyltransferase n=1 Tax=Paenibacillus sp. TaxID=58172 RepID=UPI002D2AF7A3|nr:glycosyltransferase [Paenibacillus sp.]HZG84980.1 glycosyltransferase [Paenibacillus sp.]